MKTICFAIGIVICCFTVMPAQAAFIAIPQPNAAYISSTTLIPITASDLTTLNSIADPNLTIAFSTGVEARTVPATWATWNSPPFTESSTPRVLKTPGLGSTLLTLTFSRPLLTFGLEAEPDPNVNNPTFPMTANFFSGAANIGSINVNVNGNGGAMLFAGTSTSPTGPITSINITANGTDFAVAQLRYQLAPAVPEPGTWIGLATGLTALLGYRKLCQRSSRS